MTGVDTTKPGFRIKPYQVARGQPNSILWTGNQPNRIVWTEEELVGVHGTNIADLTQTIDGKTIGADGYFIHTNVINWDEVSLSQTDGNFNNNNGYPDTEIPGMPAGGHIGNNTDYDNSAAEVLTFLQFPTGGVFYTMGVNSDDGFKVSTGQNPRDAFQSLTLGIYIGGRGANDTTFKIWVPTAGIYPVRLIWEDGGGGANCEWFTIQPDKTKILINDPSPTNTTGIKAFYSGPTTTTPAYVVSFRFNLAGGKLLLADAGTQITAGSVKLFLNGAAVPTTGGKTNGVTTVDYSLATPLPSGSTVALSVVYTDNTSASITNGTTFVAPTFTGVTKDVVHGITGFIRGKTTGFTPNAGGHTGQPGDYAIDSTSKGGTWVDIQDISFIEAAAANDTLSMAMWIKKYDIAAGSAFWAADAGGARVFQAHTPWSDDVVYFDTAGGTTLGTQRIRANINTLDAYNTVGNDGYWTNWHHFVFTKKADQKNIYIDGVLFLNDSNPAALQANFAELALLTDGFPGGDFMHGLIDDFAVYSTEISAADAVKLATGTSPSALTGETLIAYWNFNDAALAPTIGIAQQGAVLKITYTGILQSTATIGGQWNDVQGATSPYSVTPGSGQAAVSIGRSSSFLAD